MAWDGFAFDNPDLGGHDRIHQGTDEGVGRPIGRGISSQPGGVGSQGLETGTIGGRAKIRSDTGTRELELEEAQGERQ